MFSNGKLGAIRSVVSDLVTGVVFTSVVMLVVGGTTLMCLGSAPLAA
jgi:hypothetical protein